MKTTCYILGRIFSICLGLLAMQPVAECQIRNTLDDLKLQRVIDLKAETGHVQGIEIYEDSMWVTAVNREKKTGHLFRFHAKTGDLIKQVEVQEGDRYHPGGLALDGDRIWLPVAPYTRSGTSAIECRDKTTLQLMNRFFVNDHIGCVAVSSDRLIGGNWDSVNLYFWDRIGRLLEKVDNPMKTHYQDMKCVSGFLMASGLLDDQGVIDMIYPLTMEGKHYIWGNITDRGVSHMEEGMAVYNNELYLMPEDNPTRVFVYRLGGGDM